MQTRLNQFQSAADSWTVSDIQNAINFTGYMQAWSYYILGINNQDRPPAKPPHA